MRDEFPKWIKETLAKRVAFRCSNPDCRRLTSAPHSEPDGVINVGVAAHITAASQGGARYDSTLASEERRDIENGIWLCQTCGKLVDSDETSYPVPLLVEWKKRAEQATLLELRQGSTVATTSSSVLSIETYDRRIAIYRAFRKLVFMVVRETTVDSDDLSRFDSATAEARFLLGKDLYEYLHETRRKAIRLRRLSSLIDDSRHHGDPRRPSWIDEDSDLLAWFGKQTGEMMERFAPVLTLEDVGSIRPPVPKEPLKFGSLRDAGFTRISGFFKEQGYRTCVALVHQKDARLAEGFEVAFDPETGREVWVVFQAGSVVEEQVLLLKWEGGAE